MIGGLAMCSAEEGKGLVPVAFGGGGFLVMVGFGGGGLLAYGQENIEDSE